MKLIKNDKLECQIADVAEVAGYLWQRGWAERNGGNISVNVTDLLTDEEKALPAISERYPLPKVMNALKGNFFLVTGTNRRMRYVASHPMENMAVIRISDTGDWYGDQYGYGPPSYPIPLFQQNSPHVAENNIQRHQYAPRESQHDRRTGEETFSHAQPEELRIPKQTRQSAKQ